MQRGGEEEPLGDRYVAEHVRHRDGRLGGVHHRAGAVAAGQHGERGVLEHGVREDAGCPVAFDPSGQVGRIEHTLPASGHRRRVEGVVQQPGRVDQHVEAVTREVEVAERVGDGADLVRRHGGQRVCLAHARDQRLGGRVQRRWGGEGTPEAVVGRGGDAVQREDVGVPVQARPDAGVEPLVHGPIMPPLR